MLRSAKLRSFKITKLQNSSRGYILITLMLMMTLVAMAAIAVLPKMAQQVQRDREEEMVHRGTEYMRAIKKYYKKFGRYPTRIEELENTNQQRFLRKRYKDPFGNGDKEFKLVHVGDPSLNMLGMGGIGAGPGINQIPGQGGGTPGLNQSLNGGNTGFVGGPNGGVRPAGPNDTNTPQVTGLPGQQDTGTTKPAGDDAGDSDTSGDEKVDASSSSSSSPLSGQVFGGGPILGVVSTSKLKTIREYNKKNHYNDWLFIYDPSSDRGGLLQGPIQPDASRRSLMSPGGTSPGAPGQPVPTPQPGGPTGQQEPPDDKVPPATKI